jgi:Ser/Thr protein kinase RdoA (MazF antagonist)
MAETQAAKRLREYETIFLIKPDLTDDNVLAPAGPAGSVPVPDGVIDFGDLDRSWAVAEIAITLASLLHHADGSISSTMRALAACHAVRPLSRVEAEAPTCSMVAAAMMCCRLIRVWQTLCSAAGTARTRSRFSTRSAQELCAGLKLPTSQHFAARALAITCSFP